MTNTKKKILIINKSFFPGYKAGGPIKSLKNISDAIKEQVNLFILTKDRDSNDKVSYKGIQSDRWLKINGYRIFYSSSMRLGLKEIKISFKYASPDTIYLNSFFDPVSIKFLFLNKFYRKKVVLAPRGELQAGALAIKWKKKRIYLFFAKTLSLLKNVTIHSTNSFETKSISAFFPMNKIIELGNFVQKPIEQTNKINIEKEPLNFVFISRISPKKNLLFFLCVLEEIPKIKINFDIYGPIDNNDYWKICKQKIDEINQKENIFCVYKNSVPPDKIENIYQKAHYSILTTHAENFGHSIYESLACSTPVIISNNTPWKNMQSRLAGYDLLLVKGEFKKTILEISTMNNEKYNTYREGALLLAKEYYNSLDYSKAVQLFD